MANTSNLSSFLTDVADAIREKKGTQDQIPAGNFDTEIKSIETGTKINNQDKDITKNGTYTADEGYTGLGTVIVNVPQTGDVPVKLFKTKEEMNSSTGNVEGDLALVYKNEIQPITEESEFDSCTFPQTVVLKEAFTDDIYGRFRAVDSSSGMFDGDVSMSSSGFRFDGFGDTMVRVQYTSSDGITYTRTDGGEELQEFGTVIKYEPMEPWNNVIGNFMKIGGNHFEGIYTYKNDSWQLTPTQLTATSDYVYEQLLFYGKNGLESGRLGIPDDSFADTTAEVYNKIQIQYDNMEPRILTDDNKTIDTNIYFIPVKKDGTPLLDTSNVTKMITMFANCKNLTTIPELNTSKVTDMSSMFSGCEKLTAIPLLDTSSVTDMGGMFNGCTNLTTIPLLNTSKVTNMGGMFYDCSNLTTIPELDTSSATNMHAMFQGCKNLTTIPELNTSKVTDMSNMFSNCENLTAIPELNTSNATNMTYMFYDCSSLTTIPELNTNNVTNMHEMFHYCKNLTTIPELNTSNVTNMHWMFGGCSSLTTIPLLNTSNVTDMYWMFEGCSSLSDDSLNNIMQMCINATSYTGTKTLKTISLTSEQADKCKTLSNYSAFTSAGWTTGY